MRERPAEAAASGRDLVRALSARAMAASAAGSKASIRASSTQRSKFWSARRATIASRSRRRGASPPPDQLPGRIRMLQRAAPSCVSGAFSCSGQRFPSRPGTPEAQGSPHFRQLSQYPGLGAGATPKSHSARPLRRFLRHQDLAGPIHQGQHLIKEHLVQEQHLEHFARDRQRLAPGIATPVHDAMARSRLHGGDPFAQAGHDQGIGREVLHLAAATVAASSGQMSW